ncbi:MAG: hypothetical protein PHT75_01145 [Bacilli bacterium]|nr:hypothetical protein [Bacilli bacterium]MDD3304721.1 hypothetical protein [Bacilli bacterium]MDD4053600.1 hypothetical protein [Bacilli bacterium]MDD4411099.1 hypothetical protein [Bacilli bacterium]
MEKKFLYGIIVILVILVIVFGFKLKNGDHLFVGLEPKAHYKQYRIYDIIEQKGLACAEAIEILASDETYEYYFNCLKSDRIYFVSDEEVIKVHEAYDRKIITKEELYDLGIIDRLVKTDAK